MAVVAPISVSLVLVICACVLAAFVAGGVVFSIKRRPEIGLALIASGVIAFVVAGAQAEIENARNLQADRQSLEITFAQSRDLTSGDFRGRDLHQFYIADKVLSFVLFDGSNLTQAAFRCDNLQASDFATPGTQSAVLTGAMFTGDDLGSADFDHTNLHGAQFALVLGTAVPGVGRATDLSNADASNSVTFNADFSGLDAHGANLNDAMLYDVNLSSADLSGASLRGATVGGSAYPRSSLKPGSRGLGPVDLRGADLQNAHLEGADLRGAYLLGARLAGATADRRTELPKGFALSADGRHVTEEPGYDPVVPTPIPPPESPCPVDSRPHRFG